MFLGHVVEHEVEDQADALVAQELRQRLEVLDRPEVGAQFAVGGHGIPAVVVPLARAQQRHEVQVGNAELFEVVDLAADGFQCSREAVGVGGVAEHPRVLQPVGREDASFVQSVQLGIAVPVCRGRMGNQPLRHVEGPLAVEGLQRVEEVVPPSVQPQLEELTALGRKVGEDRRSGVDHRRRCRGGHREEPSRRRRRRGTRSVMAPSDSVRNGRDCGLVEPDAQHT